LRSEQRIPNYPGPAEKNINIPSQVRTSLTLILSFLVQFPLKKVNRREVIGERLHIKRLDREGLGPGTYTVKPTSTAPCFSLGSRFDSDVRSKDHLKPKKKDGPGPGSYDLPGSVNVATQLKNTTFGKATRDWSDLPKDTPAPNQYKNIIKHTETSYAYSIPKAERQEDDRSSWNKG